MSTVVNRSLSILLCLGLLMGGFFTPPALAQDGMHIAKDVPYVPTPQAVVLKMLEMAQTGPDDIVYDLGCGDGRIVITAIRDFGAKRGVGIDIDPDLIEQSKGNARVAGVADRVEFMVQDLFETDVSEATVVGIYLLSTINLRLRPNLFRDLAPGTRLVSHAFDMGTWEPDAEAEEASSMIYFWVIPANVSGQWEFTRADGKAFQGVLEQEFQYVSGTYTAGEKHGELAQVVLSGADFTFMLNGETYTAKVTGDTMTGTVAGTTWQATRTPGTAYPLEPSDPAYAEQRQKLLNLKKQ